MTQIFNQSSTCIKCDPSCLTCSNPTSCDACIGSMFLNITSSLCQFCPDGMFYSTPVQRCDSCGDSCTDKCSYQSKCFECTVGKFYDLSKNVCVDSCNSTSQISIVDSQFGNKPICRSFDYYVDSESTQIVELGTLSNPYKSLELVFVELLNYHSHSNRTVNVYIKENTVNELLISRNFIINTTTVNFNTFSINNPKSPEKAILLMKDEEVTIMSAQTQYNIIKNSDLRTTDLIQNNAYFTNDEKNKLQATDTCILISRSSVSFNNLVFKSDISNIQNQVYYIQPIYLQNKTITMTNVDFKEISGRIFFSTDPLNLHLENITMDYYNLIGGFDNYIVCNYPEAYLFDQVVIRNFTAYQSQERQLNVKGKMLSYYGVGNFTLNTASWCVYGNKLNSITPIEIRSSPDCNPQDTYYRFIEINDIEISLPENPYGDRFTQIYIDYGTAGYSRIVDVKYHDNYHFNITNSFYSIIGFFVSPTVSVFISNCTFINSNAYNGIIIVWSSENVTIDGVYFYDLYGLDDGIVKVYFYKNLILNNMVWTNTRQLSGSNRPFNLFRPLPHAKFLINNMHIYSTNLIDRPLINILGICTFTVSNSVFENLQMKTGNVIIITGPVDGIEISKITFTNITGVTPTNVVNTLFEITSIDVASKNPYLIESINIYNSSSRLLMLDKVINSPNSTKYLLINNILYTNGIIEYSTNLVILGDLETQVDFIISFTNITFSNLIFGRGGNMLYFQQQIKNSVLFNNILFYNITGGSITIESANLQNLTTPTKVTFTNLTANMLNGNYRSFINILTGGSLEINNSSFANIFNIQSGAVIYAGYTNSTTTIRNSVFTNNTSLKGGVFNIEYNSVIVLDSCVISNSFAVESGVVQSSNNGYYKFYNSIFTYNYALSSAFGEIFDVSTNPLISNCTISNNFIKSKSSILNEINRSCKDLCFLQKSFSQYLTDSVLSIKPIDYAISLISGTLSIQNSTNLNSQNYLMNSFSSSVIMKDFTIFNTQFTDNLIIIVSSSFSVSNVTIDTISANLLDSPIFKASLYTNLMFDNFKYLRSNTSLLALDSSSLAITNSNIVDIISGTYLIQMIGATNITIKNSAMNSINLDKCDQTTSIFQISNSFINLIDIFNLTTSNCLGLSIKYTQIQKISTTFFSNFKSAISLQNCNVSSIINSTFQNCGQASVQNGGAFYSLSSNFTIQDSSFINNSAIEGAAIYIDCISGDYCYSQFLNLSFKNNIATQSGGAIYYNYKRPNIRNCVFANNAALYGPDIASYAVKVYKKGEALSKINLKDVGSGVKLNQSFKLALVDYDDQIMVLDNTTQIIIFSSSNSNRVLGVNSIKVDSGVADFSNLIFIGEPGSQNIMFPIESKILSSTKINEIYGSNAFKNAVSVSFRYCMPGEELLNNLCETCAPGSYSFSWNSTKCENCMNNAVCLGGSEVNIESGYWRKTSNSTLPIECPNKSACLGGYINKEMFPVNCQEGYEGYLCSTCAILNGTKYEQVSDFQCSKCPNTIYNTLRLIGVVLLAFVFLMILVIINIRKTKESQTSVLLRIFTNYLQLITLTLSFNLKYPQGILDAFSPFETVSSSQTFLSFDCFIEDYQVRAFTPNNSLFKIFLTALLPLLIILIFCIIFLCLFYLWKSRFNDFKRNIGVSAICIIFLLHPTLTRVSFSIFQCIKVDTNDLRMRADLDIICYSGDHVKWMVALGFPIIICWVFGSFLFALYVLIKNRHHLEEGQVKRYFLILYQGLRPEVFYWEFVNTLRKVLILMCNVILSSYDGIYRAMVSIAILLIIFRVQIYLKPYKDSKNNEIEMKAILVGALSLFCGTVFISNNASIDAINILVFAFLIGTNVYFILNWTLLLLVSWDSKSKYISILIFFLSVVICNREYIDKKSYDTLIGNITSFKKDDDTNKNIAKRKRLNHKKKIYSKSTKYSRKISKKSKLMEEEEKKLDLSHTSIKLDKSPKIFELSPKNVSKDSSLNLVSQITIDNFKKKRTIVQDPIYELEEDESISQDSILKSKPIHNNRDSLIRFFKSNIKDKTNLD